jgi:hypothetical protein
MRIISKYKDYYDYLAGVVGIDDLVVYERHTMVEDGWGELRFRKGGFNPFDAIPEYRSTYYGYTKEDNWCRINVCGNLFQFRRAKDRFVLEEQPSVINYNAPHEFGEPPVKLVYYGNNRVYNPRLSDFNFGQVIPPLDVWNMLSNWFLYTPEIVDNRDDKLKIQAAGFDLKTSFRKM